MISHYIILSSSYSMGKRIALHYILDGNTEKLKEIVPKITNECGHDVAISTHGVQTNSTSWNSVVEEDHYFKDVCVIDNIDEFIALINKDRKIIGSDVAKYIVSRIKCTHLKLEKLVYYCFADYLCEYSKKLFEDEIYAYKYGPVIKSVYETYAKGSKEDDKYIPRTEELEMPSRSRITFAEDGLEKILSIDKTLKKYGDRSAAKLVDLTHAKDTPWDKSQKGRIKNEIIDIDTIKKYHCNEEL